MLLFNFFDICLNLVDVLPDLLDLGEEIIHESLGPLLLDADGDIVIVPLGLKWERFE